MKNIIVIATASRASGALTIYKQFISHLKNNILDNKYYIFIHPSMPKMSIDGVEYIEIDTTNYLKRIYFDWFGCRKVLKSRNIEPDVIISLQNIAINGFRKCKSLIYYHQSLPFYLQNWNPFVKEERILFYYKYIYPLFVKLSLNSRTKVVVQIPFIKKGFIEKFNIKENDVHVLFPDLEQIHVEEIKPYKFEQGTINFIYPATPLSYKNHITIIEALRIIKRNGEGKRMKVYFTFNKGDNSFIDSKIEEYGIQDMIVYKGIVPHKELLSMYKSCSALLFPSIIETLGLPLLEAATFGKPIMVSDLDYSREVLDKYQGQKYLKSNDSKSWAEAMIEILNAPVEFAPYEQSNQSSWGEFFKLVN